MKIWQKATLLFVMVFLTGTLGISLAYLWRSQSLNEQLAVATSKNETNIIRTSIHARLDAVSAYYHSFNAENIAMYLNPYGAYYRGQQVYLQLGQEDEILFTNFTEPVHLPVEVETAFFTLDGEHYLACRDIIQLSDGQTFDLMMIRDIQYLTEAQGALFRFSLLVAVLSTLAIAAISIVLLKRMTKPLADLGQMAQRIASGEYQERVAIAAKDEVGQFAETFNTMAASVEEQIREMDELVQDRQRFTDHLAHEIRTPITAMIGYSQVLMHTKATDADKQKAAEYIGQQSMRLKLMSEKLLHLSRLQYDQAELQPVRITPILSTAINTLQSQLIAKTLTIQTEVPDVCVMGDPVLMEMLLQNLLENAIHASTEGQDIMVTGTAAHDVLTVAIIDHGIGMDPEHLQKITEPFMSVDAARSRRHGGVGIGLALCKRICELHHTTLFFTSAPGKGTTVKVDLTIP